MYQVSPAGALGAFGVAFVAGVVGSLIVSMVGMLSLFALLYAPAIGPALGKFIIRASGGKSGTKVAAIAAGGFLVGALGASVASLLPLLTAHGRRPALPLAEVLMMGVMLHPFLWIMVAIAVVSLWVFLK